MGKGDSAADCCCYWIILNSMNIQLYPNIGLDNNPDCLTLTGRVTLIISGLGVVR